MRRYWGCCEALHPGHHPASGPVHGACALRQEACGHFGPTRLGLGLPRFQKFRAIWKEFLQGNEEEEVCFHPPRAKGQHIQNAASFLSRGRAPCSWQGCPAPCAPGEEGRASGGGHRRFSIAETMCRWRFGRERLLAFPPAGSPHYKQETILMDRSAGDKCFAETTCGLQPTGRLFFFFFFLVKNVCLAVIKRRCRRRRPGPRTLLLLHASPRPQGGGPGRGSSPPKIPTTNRPLKPALEEPQPSCLPPLCFIFVFALFTTEALKDKSGRPAGRGLLLLLPCSRSFHAITLFPLRLS